MDDSKQNDLNTVVFGQHLIAEDLFGNLLDTFISMQGTVYIVLFLYPFGCSVQDNKNAPKDKR